MAKYSLDLSEKLNLTANARAGLNSQMESLNSQAKEEGAAYPKKRYAYPEIERHLGERIFMALVGPRGAGKSTLLKQIHNKAEASFYISLDSIGELDLFKAAKELADHRGIRLLLLDEIHAYPDYGRELKKIYDFIPSLQVVFTSSSSISLHDASFDLSRRVRLITIPSFSFQEYIFFLKGEEVAPMLFAGLLDTERCKTYYGKNIHFEPLFEQYLAGGNYPFSLGHRDIVPQFQNILDTIIEHDLVGTSRITLAESSKVRQMLLFIGRSPSEGISYSSIASNTGIAKVNVQKYVELMEQAFVLRRVLPKGTNVTKEPKILFAPPYRLLYKPYEDCIGALREDFFVDAISRLGLDLNYLKGTRGEKTPDYL
ncbi:MAG: AAA family ATPase, partial [Candidatus Micrarchaeia archaeon]